jgi:tetratricopeptide (TPR) repeat protein
MPDTHLWITGADNATCVAAALALAPDASADCNRRLRGPYTGVGSLMRALVPLVRDRDPRLPARHAIELLAVAPELDPLIGPVPGTLTSLAPREERTRWYSRYRTRRISHGLVDFLRGCATDAPMTLALGGVSHADPTDLEFISIALRRLDSAQIRLVICSTGDVPALAEALTVHCERRLAESSRPAGQDRAYAECADGDCADLSAAAEFVRSDGTSDDPKQRAAYRRLDADSRARMHDERAAELEQTGAWSLRLGAIPYHLERSSRPAADVRAAYATALDYCLGMAFYDAGVELGTRLAALTDAETDIRTYYLARTQTCQCLALLERADETEPIYYDVLSSAANPRWHMNIAYAFAMLYTRQHEPEHKDHQRARAHVNTAIVIATQLADPEDRAFHTAFMNNGKALVEMHLGNLDESLRLVDEGIRRLDSDLPADKHLLHRSVLNHNRANVLIALGRSAEALADFEHVIDMDPNYAEYHFDHGNLLYKLGRHGEALAAYEMAMRLTPPFPELYYNRGDLRSATGDIEDAIADFRYVLDLEPDYVDASVNLASLLLDAGDPDAAAACTRSALQLSPDEPRLHCTLGLALIDLQECQEARAALGRALELDPGLHEARVNRAVAAYEQGDYEAAVADLTAALAAGEEYRDNPDMLYNRGRVYEILGRLTDAVTDYTRALSQPAADRSELLFRRGACYARLGRQSEAQYDLDAHLALGDSPYADDIHELLQPGALANWSGR